MTANGPRFSLFPKPAAQPEAPVVEPVAPVEAALAPVSEPKPKKALPPIPRWILEGRYTESMDAPMRRGPGSKR